MRRLVLIILALAILLPSLVLGYDVLVLQSSRNPAYEEVLQDFKNGGNLSQRKIVLSDFSEVDVVRIVREDRPGLILAVGDAALTAARTVQQIPVVAVMTLGIDTVRASRPNMTGISMFVSPASYMEMFTGMKARRVGVIYSKSRSGQYLRGALQAARQAGIELVLRDVATPRDTLRQLSTLAGTVDALWMLPDTTAVTRETSEAYFRFGQENSVPVVSFAASYIGLGAAAVIEIDRYNLGRQAKELAAAILKGEELDEKLLFPLHTTIRTNQIVLKRLGLAYKEP